MHQQLKDKLSKALENPLQAVDYILSVGRGYYYKTKYKLLGRRVSIGKGFRVTGRLSIKGPGTVKIGDNVTISMLVTPWTHDKNAVLEIGNNVYMNGTRFGCANRIVIEDDCILASCQILDTDFHGIHPKYRQICMSSPVHIGKNVWVTINCIVLKGVDIGTGSTITPASVVTTNVPPNSLFGGNPAVLVKQIL
jgi:acetyltransferase-like isoleucine patch superfamily enzyme